MTSDLLAVIGPNRLEFLVSPPVLSLVLGLTGFWIWMFVDCAKRLNRGDNRKRGWIIAIAITHSLGALAYLLFGRREPARLRRESPAVSLPAR